MVAYALLLLFVKERHARAGRSHALAGPSRRLDVPVAAAVRRLLANRPYRMYLLMRIPMTFLALLPYFTILYFCQNNLEL